MYYSKHTHTHTHTHTHARTHILGQVDIHRATNLPSPHSHTHRLIDGQTQTDTQLS